MAVIGLHESRPRRSKSKHDSIKVLPRDRMARVSETITFDEKNLVVPDVVHEESEQYSDSDNNTNKYPDLDGQSSSSTIINGLVEDVFVLNEKVNDVREELKQFKPKDTYGLLEVQMQKEVHNQVHAQVQEVMVPYLRSHTNQYLTEIIEIRETTHKMFESLNLMLENHTLSITRLEEENDQRIQRKDRSLWKKVRGINAQADAAALPALLARLQAAE